MKKVLAIIPARMGSSRFPGKPLKEICGMPMIGHVYKRVTMAKTINDTYVATCDQEIFEYIKSIGGNAIMTKSSHERCTDRTTEALLKIEEVKNKKYDIVLMIQGDEPLVTPDAINLSLDPFFKDQKLDVVNLYNKIDDHNEASNPNEIKVVFDNENFALYFSRNAIPHFRNNIDNIWYKQVCVIPFSREFLLTFSSLPESRLEKIESVDMMRVLENGYKLKMIETSDQFYSVDTQEDLEFVEQIMSKDKYWKTYERS